MLRRASDFRADDNGYRSSEATKHVRISGSSSSQDGQYLRTKGNSEGQEVDLARHEKCAAAQNIHCGTIVLCGKAPCKRSARECLGTPVFAPPEAGCQFKFQRCRYLDRFVDEALWIAIDNETVIDSCSVATNNNIALQFEVVPRCSCSLRLARLTDLLLSWSGFVASHKHPLDHFEM